MWWDKNVWIFIRELESLILLSFILVGVDGVDKNVK